jgi:exodeoxyribonuclease VII small subunit
MEKTFEASLAELEKIVGLLESGDQPLEESLKLFETGVKLTRECRERLTEAERRIEILLKDGDGKLSVADFSVDSRSGENEGAPIKRIVFGDD